MSTATKVITREEIYEAVWSKTIASLAKEWNTTYARIIQACQEMDVPRPGQDYWPNVALGRTVERSPLLGRSSDVSNTYDLLAPTTRRKNPSVDKAPPVPSSVSTVPPLASADELVVKPGQADEAATAKPAVDLEKAIRTGREQNC